MNRYIKQVHTRKVSFKHIGAIRVHSDTVCTTRGHRDQGWGAIGGAGRNIIVGVYVARNWYIDKCGIEIRIRIEAQHIYLYGSSIAQARSGLSKGIDNRTRRYHQAVYRGKCQLAGQWIIGPGSVPGNYQCCLYSRDGWIYIHGNSSRACPAAIAQQIINQDIQCHHGARGIAQAAIIVGNRRLLCIIYCDGGCIGKPCDCLFQGIHYWRGSGCETGLRVKSQIAGGRVVRPGALARHSEGSLFTCVRLVYIHRYCPSGGWAAIAQLIIGQDIERYVDARNIT